MYLCSWVPGYLGTYLDTRKAARASVTAGVGAPAQDASWRGRGHHHDSCLASLFRFLMSTIMQPTRQTDRHKEIGLYISPETS